MEPFKSKLPGFTRRKGKIDVTILDVVDPAHYVLKESPSLFSGSEEAQAFLQLQENINEYYSVVDQEMGYIPTKESEIIIVRSENSDKHYRARLQCILSTTSGPKFKVYLVDCGVTCLVRKDRVFRILSEFLTVPFQAVHFHLLGLKPLTLDCDRNDLYKVAYRHADEWDQSAIELTENIWKDVSSAQAEILYREKDRIHGLLHIEHSTGPVVLNNLLTTEKYAYFDENAVFQGKHGSENTDCVESLRSGSPCSISSSSFSGYSPESATSGAREKHAHIGAYLASLNEIECSQPHVDQTLSSSSVTEQKVDDTIKLRQVLLGGRMASHSNPSSSATAASVSPVLTASEEPSVERLPAHPSPETKEKKRVSPASQYKNIYKKALAKSRHKDTAAHLEPANTNTPVTASPEPSQESVNAQTVLLMNSAHKHSQEADQQLVSTVSDTHKLLRERNELPSDTCAVSSNAQPSSQSSANSAVTATSRDERAPSSGIESDTKTSMKTMSSSRRETNIALRNFYKNICGRSQKTQRHRSEGCTVNSAVATKPDNSGDSGRNSVRQSISDGSSSSAKPSSVPSEVMQVPSNGSPTDIYGKPSHKLNSQSSSSHPKTDASFSHIPEESPGTANHFSTPVLNHDSGVSARSVSVAHSQIPNGFRLASQSPAVNGNPWVISGSDDTEVEECEQQREQTNNFPKCLEPCFPKTESCSEIKASNLDFSKKSLFEKQGVPTINFGVAPPKPILSTEEAPFVPELQKRLKDLKFRGPSCIQSVVWPAVFRLRSFVAVSPQHSGKSVAYLLPLLSNIIQGSDYADLPASNGPLAVVLCASWKTAYSVSEQVQLFLQGCCKKIAVVTVCSEGSDPVKKDAELLKGCDILIATPNCFLNNLERGSTNFDRLCHLFLDDGNDIIKHYADKLADIMKEILAYIKLHKQIVQLPQLGVCAEHWTKGIGDFVKKFMLNELLYFTSFLEAAIYASVPTYVQMCAESAKMLTLAELIGAVRSSKTVVCTQHSDVAVHVHQGLLNSSVYSLLAHEGIPHYELDVVKRQWTSVYTIESRVVLVITDPCLISMSVTDATALIHYDLPEMSRLQFSFRFGCIADSFTNPEKSVCHVLFTKACQTQATSLVTILRRVGSEIPAELKKRSIEQKTVELNKDAPLCHYVKCYALCNKTGCKSRHTLDENLDQPSVVPHQGDITAIVSHVHSATHYVVKILSYVDPVTMASVSRSGDYAKLSISLQDYFQPLQNRIRSRHQQPGSLCVVKTDDGVFHRVRVLEILDELDARLFFIDEGWVKKCSRDFMYVLPDHLKQHSAFAAEAYLCNIQPSDPCQDWNPETNQFVFGMIGGQKIQAKIVLCLGDTLFLRPVVLRESDMSFVRQHLNTLEIGEVLKSYGYAENNKNHLSLLKKACDGKIDPPLLIKTSQVAAVKPEVTWAFLDVDCIEDVYVTYIESPQQLYIQKAKHCDSLDQLVDEITDKVHSKDLRPCSLAKKGSYCIAEIPDTNKYYRGEIVDVIEKDGVEMARVFFVDYGDYIETETSKVYPLTKEFMLFPFQAIECELAGVIPPHGGWTDCAIDSLFDETRDSSNLMKEFKIKVWEKTASCSGRNRYVADIFNRQLNLSDHLVKLGFAVPSKRPGSPDVPKELRTQVSLNVPLAYDQSSDDSIPQEEKDASALMCGVLAIMKTRTEEEEKLQAESGADDISCAHVHGDTLDNYIRKSASISSEVPVEKLKPYPEIVSECVTNLKPIVTWWNSLRNVTVTINLYDIQKYDLELSDTGFVFSSVVKQKSYYLDERFYAEVIEKETKIACFAHGLQLTFAKKVHGKWPRLVASEKKVHYIKPDLSHLTDSESDSKATEQRGTPDAKESVLHYDEDDFDSEDSGADECNTKPWTELGDSGRRADCL